MKMRDYPIIIGGGEPKQGIGIKSKLTQGNYDVFILDADMKHQYAQLHFCNKKGLENFISLLEATKKLWESEENDGKDQD